MRFALIALQCVNTSTVCVYGPQNCNDLDLTCKINGQFTRSWGVLAAACICCTINKSYLIVDTIPMNHAMPAWFVCLVIQFKRQKYTQSQANVFPEQKPAPFYLFYDLWIPVIGHISVSIHSIGFQFTSAVHGSIASRELCWQDWWSESRFWHLKALAIL